MRSKNIFWFCLALQLMSSTVLAFIPPLKMILSRTADNSGLGVYSIEQEVKFTDGNQDALIKESWFIENERTMKVHVQGLKELKGLNLTYLYLNAQKWTKKNNQKEQIAIPEEFIEKWNHFRTGDALLSSLLNFKILPEDFFQKKELKPKSANEDAFLKLSRTQGVIAYSLGDNKNYEQSPGRLWIEQDFFVIRKLRFTSGTEVYFDNYKTYSKDLHFPRERLLKWGSNLVQIKTLSVSSKPSNSASLFSSQSLDSNNQSDILFNHPLKSQIEDFYTRFR